jgi:hypothetical protein
MLRNAICLLDFNVLPYFKNGFKTVTELAVRTDKEANASAIFSKVKANFV